MNPHIALLKNIKLDQAIFFTRKNDNKNARLTNISGEPIRQWSKRYLSPIFKNSYLDGNKNHLIIQNVGDTKVIIDGNFTLLKGASHNIGSSNDTDFNAERFHFDFPEDPLNLLGTNRLEICEVVISESWFTEIGDYGISFINRQ